MLNPESPVPHRVLAAYALPAVTSSFVFTLVSLYLLKFSTDVLLVPAALVGLIFGLSRFWDALTDPIVGRLSDRTRTRWGRRRPWILAAAIPLAVLHYGIWAPPASLEGTALALWMGGAILLFYTAITCFSVPHAALGAELSADYHDRTRVFGSKALGDHLGIVLAAVALLILERSSEPRAAAATTAAVIGALSVLAIAWCVGRLKEPEHHQGRGGEKSAYKAFGDVLRNRDARLLLAVFFLEMLGYQTFVVLLPYVSDYLLETPGSTAFYLFGAIAATLLTLPLWLPLSKRFGKIPVWGASLTVKVGVFGAIGFLGAGDVVAISLLTVVFGIATGAGAVLGPSLKADVVDADEARTGDRKEGTFFSAWGLSAKMAVGCAIMLSGFSLSAVGFQPNVAQSGEALLGIRLLVSLFPLICHVLAVSLLSRVAMDEERHGEVRRTILERRAPAALGEA